MDKREVTIEIPFPPGIKLECKEGEKLEENGVIGEVITKGETKEYDLARILKINPKKAPKYLLCSLGSKVSQDQLMAEKKSLFQPCVFKSPVAGTVEALTENGVLKITMTGEKIEVAIPVKGEIEKISEKSARIKFSALVLKGVKSLGGEKWGILKIMGKREEKVELGELDKESKGKILLLSGGISQGLCHKAEALGVMGIFGGHFDTVEEDGLIIVALSDKEGIIAEKDWEELAKYDEKKVFLSGKTKELIIPLN